MKGWEIGTVPTDNAMGIVYGCVVSSNVITDNKVNPQFGEYYLTYEKRYPKKNELKALYDNLFYNKPIIIKENSMSKNVEKIIGIAAFASLFIPFVALNKHHDCRYDECMMIFADGRLGFCIESTIDSICIGIAVVWFMVITGGAMVVSKDKNAVTPFVVALLFVVAAIALACIDPSKWEFVISLIFSFVLCAISVYIDSRQKTKLKNTR